MALAEPWTEVVALQRDQARCAADIAAIKQACAKDHDKGHALECAQCWPRLVSRLRDLYFKPSSPEWFTGRRDFLQDLDNLFTKAQSSQNATLDLKPIDQRVRKEKEGWFRDKAADLGLLKATQSQGEARELQSKLSDRELPVEQLVSELRNTFPAARPDSSNETFFRQFLEQMGAAQSPKEQAGIYTEVVFKADQNSAESAKTEKYAKLINGGTPPGQALETLLRDRESSQGEQDDRRRLRNQLEELRRAKAAYQLAQSRRDKVRQEKARATAAAAAAASARKAPTLPSCATCSGAVDPQSFEMCSICQVLSSCEAGVSEPVLWCSEQCRNQTFDTHVSTTHECAGGDDCVNTYEEDIDMDQDSRVLVFCRECINDIKNPVSVFCSPRCYESNFQRHREHVHLPDREKNRRNVDDRGTLEFESVDERRYRALKIEEHFKTLDDALVEYSSMTGAALS